MCFESLSFFAPSSDISRISIMASQWTPPNQYLSCSTTHDMTQPIPSAIIHSSGISIPLSIAYRYHFNNILARLQREDDVDIDSSSTESLHWRLHPAWRSSHARMLPRTRWEHSKNQVEGLIQNRQESYCCCRPRSLRSPCNHSSIGLAALAMSR